MRLGLQWGGMLMTEGKALEYRSSGDASPDERTHEKRSFMGKNALSEQFLKAIKAEQTYLRNLDYDNEVAILTTGKPITSRPNAFGFQRQAIFEKEKDDSDFLELILSLLNQQLIVQIDQAQEKIAEVIIKMEQLVNQTDLEIERITEHLQNITRRHRELNDIIEAKYFAKNEDGTYKSKPVQDAVKAYEQRTGKKIEEGEISPEILILLLRSQIAFEQNNIIPALENRLVRLHDFRDGTEAQKEKFEHKHQQINDALEAIQNDPSLTDEERKIRMTKILEEASASALDAQMAANAAEQEYVEIIAEARQVNRLEKDSTYLKKSNNEHIELNQSALQELQNIKPIIP